MKKMEDKIAKRVFNLIIVDESGSMSIIRKQAFAGMNETLETVRKMQEKSPRLFCQQSIIFLIFVRFCQSKV